MSFIPVAIISISLIGSSILGVDYATAPKQESHNKSYTRRSIHAEINIQPNQIISEQ